MNISRTTKEKLVEEFNNILIKTIDEVLSSNKFDSIALFLSGGSLLSVYSNERLHEYLERNKEKVDIYLIDERYTKELSVDARN
ncbi:MAG: hypothetical protein WCK31_04090, partial [bacterium]